MYVAFVNLTFNVLWPCIMICNHSNGTCQFAKATTNDAACIAYILKLACTLKIRFW